MKSFGKVLTTTPLLIYGVHVCYAKSNGSHNNNHPSSQFTVYSQHVSFNPLDDSVNISTETEARMFYSDNEGDDMMMSDDDSSSIVTSSLLYEGGSIVSTEAITCQGGGAHLNSFTNKFDWELDDTDDDDDDDDDDDQDDGHSSMLSNASLRRTKVLATSSDSSDGTAPYHGGDSFNEKSLSSTSHATNSASMTKRAINLNSVLSCRGGAAAAATEMGSEFAKRLLVAAIVTLVYEAVCGHFLEFVKIVMQTSPAGTGYGNVIQTITSEKGIAGIWDGFVPWGVVQAVAKGGVFGLAHAIATSLLQPLIEKGMLRETVALTLAGGIAGGFQGFVLSPTLLLKTRVMTNPVFRESMSMYRTTMLSLRIGADVVKEEGVGALMKGAKVFATKRVFDWATRFFFSDLFESMIRNHKGGASLSAREKIVASLLGGTASTLSTLPLDVLVAKTQDAKKAGVNVSAWNLFKKDLDEKGWGGLYDSYMRGFEARLAHVCFTTVVMKVFSPLLYEAMFEKA